MIKGVMGGVIGGVVGGAIGAAIWAAVGFYSGSELGWIAWIVGALVGFLTGLLAGDDASFMTGAAAAVIALAAVAAGKFGVIHVHMLKASDELRAGFKMTDDRALVAIADQVVEEWEKASKPVKWPEGMNQDEANEEADYPKDVWADAKARWIAMDSDQREGYKKAMEESLLGELDQALASIEAQIFRSSFGPFDILWGLLAVGSAFRLGSGGFGGGDDD